MKAILQNNTILRIKRILKKIIVFNIQDYYVSLIRKKIKTIRHGNLTYKFSTPSKLCKMRAKTFSTKEPETLDWIDSFAEGSILWDIGANVGIYSVHAAKSRKCVVYSFEPSVFNLEVLARNIYLNELDSKITIMPFAINDKMGRGNLSMSTDSWGGALSTFDKTYGMDGEEFKVKFTCPIFSITLDDAISKLNLQFPDYIKIDVDGIEHLILSGGENVLKQVKGLLIELPDLWKEQTNICENILINSGMVKVLDNVWHPKENPKGSANQIWKRN